MKKFALLLLILLLTRLAVYAAPTTPPQADKAEDVVHMLLDGKDDEVYHHQLAAVRQHDTTLAAFKSVMARVRQGLGKVTKIERLQHAEEPVGGVLGVPTPEVQTAEDKEHRHDIYDTLWRLHSGTDSTMLLLTFVAENHQPRILWMVFIGDAMRTPEYDAVEKQVRPVADTFIKRLRSDDREGIIDSLLSTNFKKKLPRDHMMQLLMQVRHRIGAVAGVKYSGGWVIHDPPGVIVTLKQGAEAGEKEPYTVLVRLVKEGGSYKVDNLADLGHGAENK